MSATFEDRTTPCDFETNRKHTFLSEEVSLFSLSFFCGGKKSRKIESAKKPPYSSQSAKAHSQSRRSLKKKDRRPRGMMLSNDDGGVHFAPTLFFSRAGCRPLRPPSFCARKHRMMMPMSRDEVFALFLSKQRLWGREKTTTRERPSTQKRERRNDDDEETNRTLFLVCAVTLGRARDADDKEAANIVCTSFKRLWGTKKM